MGRKERLQKAFAYLIGNEQIKSKQQVADIMGVSRPSVSKAYNGYDSYLTNDFLKKFCFAFPNTFNLEWLVSGEGNMLQGTETPHEAPKVVEVDNGKDEIIKSLLNQNTALLSTINRLADELAWIKEEIKRLRVYSSVHTYSVPSDDVKATLNDTKEAY